MRIRSVDWGTDHVAIVNEWRWLDRQVAFVAFDPSASGNLITLYAGSSQDRYHSPGKAVSQTNERGMPALKFTRDGNITFGGALPCTTFGGSIGEGRLHGMGHLREGALQVMGRAEARQVPNVEHCLVMMGSKRVPGAAIMLLALGFRLAADGLAERLEGEA